MLLKSNQSIQQQPSFVCTRHQNRYIHSFVKQSGHASLQSYYKCKAMQYQSVFTEFQKQEQNTLYVSNKLLCAKDNLSSEKYILAMTLDKQYLQLQLGMNQKDNYQKMIIQQQEELSMLQQKNQQQIYKLDQNRRQNLEIMQKFEKGKKEKQQQRQKTQSIESEIQIIQEKIENQKQLNTLAFRTLSNTEQIVKKKQQENRNVLANIEKQQDLINHQTFIIEGKLKQQSELIGIYSECKQLKNELGNEYIKKKKMFEEQILLLSKLQSTEIDISISLEQKNQLIASRKVEIIELADKVNQNKQAVISNRICLSKVRRYLECLINQNQKLQYKIQTVLQEDRKVKTILDRKYSQKYASFISNETDHSKYLEYKQQREEQYCKSNAHRPNRKSGYSRASTK